MVNQMQDKQINQKSVKLTPQELRKLKIKVRKYPTRDEAVSDLGLKNRGTLARIIAFGSGSSENVATIRSSLG